jgi:predicted 3-demethylubiquinone-9 3-methyltransferase (glyoxalase superfamily)
MKRRFVPCLWFDKNAQQAAKFYVSVFPKSKIDKVHKSPADYPSGKRGDILMVDITINGQKFILLNGGPYFKLSEAVSFTIACKDQKEVDRMTNKLSAVPEAEQCGWIKDKFGLSWQVVPEALPRLMASKDPAKAKRVMEAMMQMKRLNVAELERAAKG